MASSNSAQGSRRREGVYCPARTPLPNDVYLVVPPCSPKVLQFDRPWYIAWFGASDRIRVLELSESPDGYAYKGSVLKEGIIKPEESFLLGSLTPAQRTTLEEIAQRIPVNNGKTIWNSQEWVKDVIVEAWRQDLFTFEQIERCNNSARIASYSW